MSSAKSARQAVDVKELSKQLHEERLKLTLFQRPFKALFLFLQLSLENLVYFVKELLVSKIFLLVLLPICLGYGFSKYNSLFQDEVTEFEHYVMYFTWWFGLGVLSSVGLGSGMHSGMLFLFPHIFNVVSASNNCSSMNFVSTCDMWWQRCDMNCLSTSNPLEKANLMSVILKVLPASIIWGTGTAFGEVPPYLVSRAAAVSGEMDDDTQELLEETKGDDPFSKMKKWMIDFVEHYGFFGVLVMSAWPNAAFDLVGICCGQLGVSFFNFLIPTIIGKGFIKVSGQALFFCFWFRNPEVVIGFFQSLAVQAKTYISFFPWDGDEVKSKLENALSSISKGKVSDDEEVGWFRFLADIGIKLVLLTFLVSTIQHLAHAKQKSVDDEKLKKIEKSN